MSGQQHDPMRSHVPYHLRASDSGSSQTSPHLAFSNGFFNNSHQLIVSGGNFNYIQSNNPGFLLLENAAVSAAMHTSGQEFQRPGCYENTRVAVLNRLRNWGIGDEKMEGTEERVMWLYGDAGAGKSAIAQTLAVECARVKRLLGSFFFFRNDPARADYRHLPATLAYHLMTVIPVFKEYVCAIVERDPKIFEQDLELQLESLLIKPLNALVRRPGFPLFSIPCFIIIDGLDECSSPDKQCHFLKVLEKVLQKCDISLKALITSRPEIEIKAAFNSAPFTSLAARLALDNKFKPDKDILVFLTGAFETIKETHPFSNRIPAIWPAERHLDTLVKKSSGQFIYASVVAKYVSSTRHKPVQRLDVVLGLRPDEREKEHPFAELDALYTFLFSTIPPEKLEIVRKILGLVIIVWPLHPDSLITFATELPNDAKNICELLSLEPGDEEYYLADLASVIQLNSYGTKPCIQITHASLGDFLFDSKRSKDFFISPSAFVSDILHIFFKHLNDLTINRELLRYCFACLPSLLPRADFTSELRNDLLLFSLLTSSDNVAKRSNFHESLVAMPSTLPCINIHEYLHLAIRLVHVLKDLADASLLSHYKYNFDCLFQRFFEKRCCDRILLITTLIDVQFPWSFYELVTNKQEVTFLGSDSCCQTQDLAFLARYCINTQGYFDRAWVMREFFKDPHRAGNLELHGTRYATATIECLSRASRVPQGFKAGPRPRSLNPDYYEISASKVALFVVPHLLERAALAHELVSLINSGEFEQKYDWVTLPAYKSNQGVEISPQELVANVVQASQDYLKRFGIIKS